ncbi:MAG: ABC transporter ATP-binding protein [Candidatus Paracaedibacteraceae bacterium]|nr:ABC transporter ATP-binding protein [Candidatus Paracaedibacteraceae bacterium]
MTKSQFNYINCLKPLLRILGWQGSPRDVFEAVPCDVSRVDLIDLENIFVDLGYTCYHKPVSLNKLSRSFLPTLFINEKHNIFWVIYEKTERDYLFIDCMTGQKSAVSISKKITGTRYNFIKDGMPKQKTRSLLDEIIKRVGGDLKKPVFFSTLIAFSVLLPLLMLQMILSNNLFHQEIPIILSILGCLGGIVLSIYILSWVKNKTLAYLSARLSILSNREALHHLLYFNTDYRHNLVLQTEINHLKQVDAMQGKLATFVQRLMSGVPMVLVPLLILWLVNGSQALTTTIALGTCCLYLRYKSGRMKSELQSLSQAEHLYGQFIQDSAVVVDDIKDTSSHRLWGDRLKTYLADYLHAHKISFDTLGQIRFGLKLILTVVYLGGVVVAYKTTGFTGYSVPNLILSTALVYFIVTSFYELSYLIRDFFQLKMLIQESESWLQGGGESNESLKTRQSYGGAIDISDVSFTYPGQNHMALQSITVSINPGEVVAVMGHNASGKSTLIKLLMGLYQPSQGSINFDGTDLQGLNIHHHRQSIGYVSSQIDLFSLSIAQNLRLAQPDVTDREIITVLDKLDALSAIEQLPEGIHTILTPELQKTLPSALLQKINLARAFVRESKILIFDEPTGNLDMKADAVFKSLIQSVKGHKTVLIVTHRPSIINLADQVLVLNNGIMRLFGPKAQVLKILSGNAA